MAVEQTYIKVYCPHNGRIRKVPIGMTNTLAVVQNTCDFSNGCAPCETCVHTLQSMIIQDRSIVYKSHEEPLSLFLFHD